MPAAETDHRTATEGHPQERDPVPLHRLEVPAPDVLPFAMGSFDTIGPLSRADFPHRHTFHEVVYVTGGRGLHVVDSVPSPLDPPHLSVVLPGQVHAWAHTSDLHGWVILFSDDFLLAHPRDQDLLRELGQHRRLRPTGQAESELAALIREMDREFQAQREGFISVLQSYLHVLLLRSRRLLGAAPPEAEPGGRAAALAREFTRLLAQPGQADRSVADWAARLGVSASHLNHAVRQSTGRTPGQLIRQFRTLEAKRLLAGSDLTVRQVARRVGFADPAYFCRFFRRETGTTPGEFRRAAVGNHHDRRVVSIDPAEPPA